MANADGSDQIVCEPLTTNCRAIVAAGQHVVIGVSPGNSYFSAANMSRLLGWASRTFEQVDVIIPDSAFGSTLRAAGYGPERILSKTRATVSLLRNRVLRALQPLELGDKVHLSLLSHIVSSSRYRAVLETVRVRLAKDTRMQEVCARASAGALRSYLGGREPTTAQLVEATEYIAAELPFFVDSPTIFGVGSSTAIYHQRVGFVDTLHLERGELIASTRQAFAVVRAAGVDLHK